MIRKAFVSTFTIPPYPVKNAGAAGALNGLTFAVKDNIAIKNMTSAWGNPLWAQTHSAEAAHAICVEQLLAQGATCIGKTVCGELGFGLTGINQFYGTPINPHAPDRIPGGSSGGSAAIVAAQKADFALGTDAGGSIRVPASYCGVYGFYPSRGVISTAGINIVSPSFETAGILAHSLDILTKVASIFLDTDCSDYPDFSGSKIYIAQNLVNMAAPEIQEIFNACVGHIIKNNPKYASNIHRVENHPMDANCDSADIGWAETFKTILCAEMWNAIGAWVESSALKINDNTYMDFTRLKNIDRTQLGLAFQQRQKQMQKINAFLSPRHLLCFPTTPTFAPKFADFQDVIKDTDYRKMRAFHCIAALANLPQISIPIKLNDTTPPMGISLAAAHGNDAFLLDAAKRISILWSQT